jgi:hypothetical protein
MFGYRAVSHRASTYLPSSLVDRRVHIVADEVMPRGKPVFTFMYSISSLAIPLNVCRRAARLVYRCSAIPPWLPPDCRSASGDGGVDRKVPKTTSPPGVSPQLHPQWSPCQDGRPQHRAASNTAAVRFLSDPYEERRQPLAPQDRAVPYANVWLVQQAAWSA